VLEPRGRGHIDRRADDIAEFLEPWDRVVLVGWSLGALEALHYVHRHGEAKLAGLVLVDSSVGEDPEPPPSDFLERLRRDRRSAIIDFVRAMFRKPRSDDEIAALVEHALSISLEDSLALFPRALPREHWRNIARGFGKPLLCVVTPQFAEQAENLKRNRPATRVEVVEQAGHALFVDEAERFSSLLLSFVEAL
jgi:microsomal epoxide hydrolase